MPMRIIFSDSSCLIDLRKVSLFDSLLCLPYEFLIPNTLFDEELVEFSPAQKKALIRAGLKPVDLPGERVLRAQAVIRECPRLSVHDAFAFALAELHPGCILFSEAEALRTLAASHSIEVHGVLWSLDQMHHHRLESAPAIAAKLRIFLADASVRLPRRELVAYIKKYETIK